MASWPAAVTEPEVERELAGDDRGHGGEDEIHDPGG